MNPHMYYCLLTYQRTFKYHITRRKISKYLHKDISAKNIRQSFLDYFLKRQDHVFIRSSPVVPFCDPTVPFVNAGMNQFKGIFLGNQIPHFTKVANSQKCIRVGGKHNDLNVVGKDGYHHTFFEMLGNWSFGEYFKEDACKMAWELLTQVYKIPPTKLYVTYFSGDDKLGLKSDLETKEIWKNLGINEKRILPYGTKDNFWEMGVTGPCGPCTEIHYDHLGTTNRSEFVNRGLYDLTEIWNLVFIQYNRLSDGSIVPLPKSHVDTGLGLERLCCALQGTLSTYDTDLFDYLIKAIEKNCINVPKYSGHFGEQDWNDLDASYRILADHVRMLTVCLADGVVPEQNQKLRRIIRKCLVLSQTVFGNERGLIKELTNYVVENLGDVYPEMERNISLVHQILDYEEEVYRAIHNEAKKEWTKFALNHPNLPNIDSIDITPSFIKAFKELHLNKVEEIDENLAYKLYDTHGFDAEGIQTLAQLLNIKFNEETFTKKMDQIKLKSKSNREILVADQPIGLPPTDDSDKYCYSKTSGQYNFPETHCQVIQILADGALVLDKTNLYSESGGQQSDTGTIKFENGATFFVHQLENVRNTIIHKGNLSSGTVKPGLKGSITINQQRRLGAMRNHTCAHLLNAAIKKIKSATCQKSSKVTDKFVNLDVSVFGPKLNVEDVVKVEEIVNGVIADKAEVRVSTTDSQGLYSLDNVTLIPGEVYPDREIRLVEVEGCGTSFVSREPCCGTHVLNTGDLEDFCVVSLKSLGRSSTSLHGVTGDRAKLARKNAEELAEDLALFKASVQEYLDKPEVLEMGILSLKKRLNYEVTDDLILPYAYKQGVIEELNDISRQIKDKSNEDLRSSKLKISMRKSGCERPLLPSLKVKRRRKKCKMGFWCRT
ncbi:alanine--tRNA ligase, mitochondrial isoform X2 [Anthonomus grandis grandis]|uniref:alanine--tRNA ligase, mitochondrial isoform X2 n=1 Tax=Anthonomus grandis grandis TaxID=2921223 RepID=UPI002165C4AB|nr:alanine--tRNA ligase, mitochondrial isoform X2 [Anthonomus grandis grandis]